MELPSWPYYETFASTSDQICYNEESPPLVSSQKELCIKMLASDCHLLPMHPHDIPLELKQSLLSAAMWLNRRESVTAMLKLWEHADLKVELPPDFKTWRVFPLQKNLNVFGRRVLQLLFFVRVIISRCMRLPYSSRGSPAVVQCFDFSELGMSDDLVGLLCRHIHNRIGGDPVGINIPKLSGTNPSRSQFPFKQHVIKVNCIIEVQDTARVLAFILRRLEDSKTHFLVITGMHISDTDDEQILQLLNLLDPRFLNTFTYCRMQRDDHDDGPSLDILRTLKKFTQLKCLDLTNFSLGLSLSAIQVAVLSELLSELVNLKQLDLSVCVITGMLGSLLSKLYSSSSGSCTQLECLALRECYLSSEDLEYLAHSPHAATLRNLNLRTNVLDIRILGMLLAACRNLFVLDVEECEFSNGSAIDLFCVLSTMPKLRFLDFSFSSLSSEELLNNAAWISQMPSLECLRVYFVEWTMLEDKSKHEILYLSKLRHAIMSIRSRALKPVELLGMG